MPEKEKGFLEQINESVAPFVALIIIIILLYVLQATVNVMNFLSQNPWVGWVILGLICVIGFFYIWIRLDIGLLIRGGFTMDVELLDSLPPAVKERLEEAQGTYRHGHYRSCSVMLRGALETAISIRFKNAGKARTLKGKNLPQRIELAKQEGFITPSIATRLNQLVKWIGDIGAHDYKVKIKKEDVETSFNILRVALEHMFH